MNKKITVGELIDLLKEFDPSLFVTSYEYHGYTSYIEEPILYEDNNKKYVDISGIDIYGLRDDPDFLDDEMIHRM